VLLPLHLDDRIREKKKEVLKIDIFLREGGKRVKESGLEGKWGGKKKESPAFISSQRVP